MRQTYGQSHQMYLDGYNQARKAAQEGRLDDCQALAHELLADPGMPLTSRIRTIILLGAAGGWHEAAENCKEVRALLYRTRRSHRRTVGAYSRRALAQGGDRMEWQQAATEAEEDYVDVEMVDIDDLLFLLAYAEDVDMMDVD